MTNYTATAFTLASNESSRFWGFFLFWSRLQYEGKVWGVIVAQNQTFRAAGANPRPFAADPWQLPVQTHKGWNTMILVGKFVQRIFNP